MGSRPGGFVRTWWESQARGLDAEVIGRVGVSVWRGNLTGSSCCVVHSVLFSFIIVCNLSSVGRAMAPAVAAMYRGDSADKPSKEQNSRVNDVARYSQVSSFRNVWRYGDAARLD